MKSPPLAGKPAIGTRLSGYIHTSIVVADEQEPCDQQESFRRAGLFTPWKQSCFGSCFPTINLGHMLKSEMHQFVPEVFHLKGYMPDPKTFFMSKRNPMA